MAPCTILRKGRRQWFQLALAASFVLAWGTPATAQIHKEQLKSAVVKVTVTDPSGKGQSATGFLWQSPNQVVTSLHAVLHLQKPNMTIRVICDGARIPATVVKVLKNADLVLLKPDRPVEGCRVFDDNFRMADAARLKPQPRANLYTFGWKGGASTATSRDLRKSDVSGTENLDGLIDNRETKKAIVSLKLPSLYLDVYHVGGDPLSGGYSGGPVVDDRGKLVGIVDGGLDKGMSSYNWLIPAVNLSDLQASTDRTVPVVDLSLLGSHFSAGIVEPAGVQTEVAFAPRPAASQSADSRYLFVKTKTRTLAQLANTSEDPEGIRRLVSLFRSVVGPDAEHRLRFDIYEDVSRGLIIAVPEGQGLIDGPMPNYPDIHKLRSEAAGAGDGFIQFEALVPDERGFQRVATFNGSNYYPKDHGYFDAYVQETLSDCKTLWNNTCVLDDRTHRVARFSNGGKVLNFGFMVHPDDENDTPAYDYYSVAVKDNVAFTAYSRVHIWAGDEGLFQCQTAATPCDDVSTALVHLSQLVAAQLTSFGDRRPRAPIDLQVQ